jgi:mono/diheme cytochrome c family protein
MMRPRSALASAGAAALLIRAMTVQAQDAPGGGPTSVQVSQEGKQVYEEICQACHMADAKGGGGAGAGIPALAGNPKLADKTYLAELLLKGRGGMPWFTDMLTPAQMAAVSTYVRSHFNSYPDPVTEADIRAVAAASPRKADCETCGQ